MGLCHKYYYYFITITLMSLHIGTYESAPREIIIVQTDHHAVHLEARFSFKTLTTTSGTISTLLCYLLMLSSWMTCIKEANLSLLHSASEMLWGNTATQHHSLIFSTKARTPTAAQETWEEPPLKWTFRLLCTMPETSGLCYLFDPFMARPYLYLFQV